jgi:hypothetical protein
MIDQTVYTAARAKKYAVRTHSRTMFVFMSA